MERFVIGREERRRRWINVGWGLLFSGAIVVAVGLEHQRDPERYGSVLLWSVASILAVANLANLVFFLRYLRLIGDHCLEVLPAKPKVRGEAAEPGKLRFFSAGKWTELELEQVTAIRLFTRWGKLRHVQLLLSNNRGIRLEGYQDLPRLAETLQTALPGKLIS